MKKMDIPYTIPNLHELVYLYVSLKQVQKDVNRLFFGKVINIFLRATYDSFLIVVLMGLHI